MTEKEAFWLFRWMATGIDIIRPNVSDEGVKEVVVTLLEAISELSPADVKVLRESKIKPPHPIESVS